ncbi:MAG: hypothetical protein KIT31_37740 [Deltaproteobacteria bacterium]|nr:hypothetical protein [Deltaproteobacteria bacterium]
MHDRQRNSRELLASAGGSPQRPMVVPSASVIEGRAARSPCPHCGPDFEARVIEHTRPAPRLRRVDIACRQCSLPRTLWFTIAAPELN